MEKIYCGSGKAFSFQTEKGEVKGVNISLCLTKLPKEHISEYNGEKYIKLTLTDKGEPDQYKKTHSLSVNTWKPEPKKDEGIF